MRRFLLMMSMLLICSGCFGINQNRDPDGYEGQNVQEGQDFLPYQASDFHMSYTFFGSTQAQIDFVNRTNGNLQVVAPSYFDINTDGSLKLTNQLSSTFINEMHRRNIKVVPFLSNHWDRNLGRAGLANKEHLSRQIAQAIQTYNLDGVNVDIENVTHVDKDDFTELVRLLRSKVPHHKEVSVAVAANPQGWTQGWHGMYDYPNLAKHADYLMVMAYDESYIGGSPGPVASKSWVEKGIVELLQHAPRNKIVLGLPFFGRYWQEGAAVGGYGVAKHMADTLVQRYNGSITFDEQSQSPRVNFTIRSADPTTVISGRTLQPGNYTLWFENQRSLQGKFDLIRKYSLAGSGSWALGLENPAIWTNYGAWVMPNSENQAVKILPGHQITGVVTSTTLNIRQEPTTTSSIDGELKNGEIVIISDEMIQSGDRNWYPIYLENNDIGYLAADYVKPVQTRNLFGRDRYMTSVNIAHAGWPDGSETVVLGRGDLPVDALPGSVLAAKLDAPLLLTRPDTLPTAILDEIKRLGAERVVLLGGEGAISAQTQRTLEQSGMIVQRVFGSNRFDTSVQIANEIGVGDELILVTGQETSPDSLAIAPYAGIRGIPMLLSSSQTLPREVHNYIKNNSVKNVTVIGGKSVISENILQELRLLKVSSVERISGTDRFSTSVEIAKRFEAELHPNHIYFASGLSFIDALPGAALATRDKAPMILTNTDTMPNSVSDWIRNDGRIHQNAQINFLGGSFTITANSRARILQQIISK
ncbi:cell wall-binding repeat-containing protein [Bacillus suaedae]|uniref:Cell wall-binding repeat-containing protein n=1 Tax=Halalkalibacter suaedae TaxID=2822140 RepID=A0A941ATS9_9BACI|nr:cell wall-binding repeat-containing protein [Bacillus suaedae]MBP3952634.1 cell wall-binding repeat-containing protein [Bacillus suaedae]